MLNRSLAIILFIPLLIQGCSSFGPTFLSDMHGEAKFIARDFIPRHMRDQIHDGTPVANKYVNQADLAVENYGRIDPYSGVRERVHLTSEDDSYGQGFQDGCQTMTGVMGAGTYRMLEPKIDGERLTNDPWYLRGYQDASTYCTFRLDWETH